jgi:hypothetical protein
MNRRGDPLTTWWAIVLALDLETCERLLLGLPVAPERLDPAWLARAREFELVRLDLHPADLFNVVENEAA